MSKKRYPPQNEPTVRLDTEQLTALQQQLTRAPLRMKRLFNHDRFISALLETNALLLGYGELRVATVRDFGVDHPLAGLARRVKLRRGSEEAGKRLLQHLALPSTRDLSQHDPESAANQPVLPIRTLHEPSSWAVRYSLTLDGSMMMKLMETVVRHTEDDLPENTYVTPVTFKNLKNDSATALDRMRINLVDLPPDTLGVIAEFLPISNILPCMLVCKVMLLTLTTRPGLWNRLHSELVFQPPAEMSFEGIPANDSTSHYRAFQHRFWRPSCAMVCCIPPEMAGRASLLSEIVRNPAELVKCIKLEYSSARQDPTDNKQAYNTPLGKNLLTDTVADAKELAVKIHMGFMPFTYSGMGMGMFMSRSLQENWLLKRPDPPTLPPNLTSESRGIFPNQGFVCVVEMHNISPERVSEILDEVYTANSLFAHIHSVTQKKGSFGYDPTEEEWDTLALLESNPDAGAEALARRDHHMSRLIPHISTIHCMAPMAECVSLDRISAAEPIAECVAADTTTVKDLFVWKKEPINGPEIIEDLASDRAEEEEGETARPGDPSL